MEKELVVELFFPVQKPYVQMYGAAANAGGQPLANVIDLLASVNHYVAVIELPLIQFCNNEVDWTVSSDSEVTIEGQITRAAMFANMPTGSKSKRIKLCPTETWAITFFFPTPINYWTTSVLFTSQTVMEIAVMKAAGSIPLPITQSAESLAETLAWVEAWIDAWPEDEELEDPEGVSSPTPSEVEEELDDPEGASSPTPSEVEEMIEGWLV